MMMGGVISSCVNCVIVFMMSNLYNAKQTSLTDCGQIVYESQCTLDGIELRCLWLVGNASSSKTPTSICVSEVCLLLQPNIKLKTDLFFTNRKTFHVRYLQTQINV
jgi:hypothetical protein